MPYEITYARSALKALRQLARGVAHRRLRGIDSLAVDPYPAGSLQLRGGSGEVRIRVGDYRVVYDVVDNELVILLLRVGHRREVYR